LPLAATSDDDDDDDGRTPARRRGAKMAGKWATNKIQMAGTIFGDEHWAKIAGTLKLHV